jgi:uncharacterized integral membrane protein (TIGR00697 family)
MVFIGFGMSFLMLLIVQIALFVPAHPYWMAPGNTYGYTSVEEYQNAFASVFSVNGKLLFGSMLAYAVAQLLDVKLFHFWKKLTRGKFLWLRNNASTLVSQMADTFIVNSILFYWGFGWELYQGLTVMAMIYLYKLLIALIDTPIVYLAIWMIRKRFGLKPREGFV